MTNCQILKISFSKNCSSTVILALPGQGHATRQVMAQLRELIRHCWLPYEFDQRNEKPTGRTLNKKTKFVSKVSFLASALGLYIAIGLVSTAQETIIHRDRHEAQNGGS